MERLGSLVGRVNAYSTFLFPTPSGLRGAASVIDLNGGGGGLYNNSSSVQAADARALRADSLAALDDAQQAVKSLIDDIP